MKRLFVGNMPFGMTVESLTELFGEFGGANAAIPQDRDTGRPKGFGFVEVDDDKMQDAISAVNGKEVEGRALTVNEARPREERPRGNFGGNGGGYGGNRGGWNR